MGNDGQQDPVVRDSIKKGIALEGVAKFLIVVKHFLLLPIFLKAWGADIYGEWVLLTSLAMMLEIARLGIGTATSNELIGSLERRETNRFNLIFWSGAIPLSGVVFLITCLGVSLFLSGWNIHSALPDLTIPGKTATAVFACSIVKIGGGILNTIPVGALLAIKGYSFVRIWAILSQIVIMATSAAALWLGASPSTLAIIDASLIWALSIIAILILVRFRSGIGPIPEDFREGFVETWKRLFSPSLAFFLLPCIGLIMTQLPTIILGSYLGGIHVAAFTACRTVTNALLQGLTLVTSPSWRSLTASAAAGEWDRVNMIMSRLLLYTFLLVTIGGLMLLLLDRFIFELWLGSEFLYDRWIFRGLIACVGVAAFANVFSLLPHATNRNLKMSLGILGWAGLTMASAWLLVRHNHSAGFVIAGLLTARLGQLAIAWWHWRKIKRSTA